MSTKRDKPDKPFPWRCPNCGQRAVQPATVDHVARIRYEGKLHHVRVPQLECTRCEACGERFFGARSDEQIAAALRAQLGLLSPEQIRAERKRLDLTQKELAEALGVAPETISRWESGLMIQSRAMDRFLRVLFNFPRVRTWLRRRALVEALRRAEPTPVSATRLGEAGRRKAVWLNLVRTSPKWGYGRRKPDMAASRVQQELAAICRTYDVRGLTFWHWVGAGEEERHRGFEFVADFEPQRKPGLLRMMELRDRLSKVVGAEVEVCTPQELSEEAWQRVESESETVVLR